MTNLASSTVRLAVIVLLPLLAACATSERRDVSESGDGDPLALLPGLEDAYPATPRRLPTTSGERYMDNLDARIDSLESSTAESTVPAHAAALAANLYHRYRIVGRIEDAERALAIVNLAVNAHPDNTRARRVRAAILAGFHRFDEALADVDAIAGSGSAVDGVESLRTEINLALGRYDRVRDLFDQRLEPVTDFHESVLLGNLAVMHGELTGASVQFFRAQQNYTDSSPFQLAWLYTQQGIALLRFGNFAAARPFFEAALDRVPDYYLAAEHLAECEFELGELDAARSRYQSVIDQTGFPEFIGALAALEAEAGNESKARELRGEAAAAWDSLLGRHKAAFADHAVDFHLGAGETGKALQLTRFNLTIRRDVLSLLLHAEAAEAGGLHEEACATLEEAVATGLNPPEMNGAKGLAQRCGNALP